MMRILRGFRRGGIRMPGLMMTIGSKGPGAAAAVGGLFVFWMTEDLDGNVTQEGDAGCIMAYNYEHYCIM
jgi:hypothetical protein